MNFEEKRNLVEFFKLLQKIDKREEQRKERLQTEPKGFAVEATYNCMICGYYTNQGWYTELGVLCVDCRKSIKNTRN